MEQEKLEGLLIDYIDGKLSDGDQQLVLKELADNPDARRLYEQLKEVMDTMKHSGQWEPTSSLQRSFDHMLQDEMRQTHAGKQVFFGGTFFRAAAAVGILVAGTAIGLWINKNIQTERELEALRQEMAATKQMMMTMLDNRESASQRVQGATVAFTMKKADDQIVQALAKAMNEDPNTNVRLAALEALGRFRTESTVRKALISSLATQKDPVVQIALIQLLVQMKEKEVVNELKKLTDDELVLPAVRDEAHAGILKLS